VSDTAAATAATATPVAKTMQGTTLAIILMVSFGHMVNDIIQSLLGAIYPLLQMNYSLTYTQVGLLTLVFQCTASILQPAIGIYTDKRALPYSLPWGMLSSLLGLVVLAYAGHYWLLLVGAAMIGVGSAVFHPEASRVARLASGGRFGLAQSVFQVGGNFGSAIGPLLAAFVVVPFGQSSLVFFTAMAGIGIFVLYRVGRWYAATRKSPKQNTASTALVLPRKRVVWALIILTILVFSKNAYTASISSYYTFYVIEKFGVGVQQSQVLLFIFLGAIAAGTVLGGPLGDRIGHKAVIWFSILGVLPFTLALPYANYEWTIALSIIIGLILSSAFSNIVVFAQELVPGRVGMIAGIFFGLAFGMGGLAAAGLGVLADRQGIEFVYKVCSFLPLAGLLTVLLPGSFFKQKT
jgi:FSR family fosmidomycin resistance protein-like MFS transporter